MHRGYIKWWRKIEDSAVWQSYYHPQKVLFAQLLKMANYQITRVSIGGEEIELQPGQLWTSQETLMKRAYMTRQEVRTSLKNLEKLQFLTRKLTKRGSIITINNWDIYQTDNELPNQESNQALTSHSPSVNQALTMSKEGKEGKKVKNNILSSEKFDAFWKHYPRKIGKSKAVAKWNARIRSGADHDDLIMACRNYAEARRGEEMKFTKHPSTFLGSDWQDWLKPSEPDPDDEIPEYYRADDAGPFETINGKEKTNA